jgi:hypothetical protein
MNHRWTEADVARLTGQKVTRQTQETRTRSRRVGGRDVPQRLKSIPRSRQIDGGWILVYQGWLPRISNKRVHPLAVWRLMRRGREIFGALPPMLYPQTRARVQVIRVLGPGQKPMDRDKIALTCAGLVDALTPSYLRDDSERYADITYTNDATRRQDGPSIEIVIQYEEPRP